LRERREDIPILARTSIVRICKKIGKKPKKISPEALEFLLVYDWQGNIRELENVLERAINIGEGNMIGPEDLPQKVIDNKKSCELVKVMGVGSLKDAVKQTEKKILKKTLNYTEGSRKEAIKLLNIGKTSFYDKLNRYDID
jgi:transcriptional regulator with PAS, ATPase and Fis domain